MSMCISCNNDMKKVKSCNRNSWITLGKERQVYTTIPYINPATFDNENPNCHDCGVQIGAKHHPCCDMERCPRCGLQLISCDCAKER